VAASSCKALRHIFKGGSASPENASPARTDGSPSRRKRKYRAAEPHSFANALRTTHSTALDVSEKKEEFRLFSFSVFQVSSNV
jgi:hypothetical protein